MKARRLFQKIAAMVLCICMTIPVVGITVGAESRQLSDDGSLHDYIHTDDSTPDAASNATDTIEQDHDVYISAVSDEQAEVDDSTVSGDQDNEFVERTEHKTVYLGFGSSAWGVFTNSSGTTKFRFGKLNGSSDSTATLISSIDELQDGLYIIVGNLYNNGNIRSMHVYSSGYTDFTNQCSVQGLTETEVNNNDQPHHVFEIKKTDQGYTIMANGRHKYLNPTGHAYDVGNQQIAVTDDPFYFQIRSTGDGSKDFYVTYEADVPVKPEYDDYNVEVAKVRKWDLAGADESLLNSYDDIYRVNFTGNISTNNGNYSTYTTDKTVDNDENTFWETGNHPGTDSTYLEFAFGEAKEIGRLVYGTRKDSAAGKGFPHKFLIQASQTESGDDFKTVAKGRYDTRTSDYMEIIFTQQSFRRLRFVFLEASEGWPSCREMKFYKEDKSDDLVGNLFTDYKMLTLNEDYDTEEELLELETKLKENPTYELKLKDMIERAKKVQKKELVYNERYEFSTAKDASNVISQNGNVADYARKKLQYSSFATNRQVTGLNAYAGDTITVYVEGKPDDPLPKIRFSQAYGYWSSWLGNELQLQLGRNTFVVPNFKNDAYTTVYVPAAGPLYIVNPYTPEEQSDQVRVYIEGCDAYPVFRLGDDEKKYKEELTAYADRVRSDSDHVIDVTELVCNHAIMTVTATRADEIYDIESPQENLVKWDEILRASLEFDGIKFDKDDKYYSEMNEHLNVNYRVNQVWPSGFMFTLNEEIGLYAGDSGENTLIYCMDSDGDPQIGWGFVHEMGHAIDLPLRVIVETTNNMVANFVNTYYNGEIRNEDYISIARSLASERDWTNNGYNQNRYNYMVFFLLESFYPGYWGDSNNLYRYVYETDTAVAGLNKTERYVYYASLAAGVDLGYYFERWGFNMDEKEPIFSVNSTTEAYKAAINEAKAQKKIIENELPIWYLDSKEYAYIRDNHLGTSAEKEKAKLYTEEITPEAPTVVKTSAGYGLTLPIASDREKHLGYEIWEGRNGDKKRIGFTVGDAFTDTYSYDNGYTPTYSIVAYDRVLSHSGFSAEVQPTSPGKVCEVRNVQYETLAEAIENAAQGDTIYLLTDIIDSGIVVTKNVTITPKEHDITISRVGNASLFSLYGSVNLKIISSEGKTITLDGKNLVQDNPLVYITENASLDMEGGIVQNNISSGYGAIAAVNWYSYPRLKGVKFVNNKAVNGGAVYNHGFYPNVNNCTFIENSATYGGAIYNTGGYITINNATAIKNHATYGGVLYVDGSSTINSGTFTQNSAEYGGAVAVRPAGYPTDRTARISADNTYRNTPVFTDNKAGKGNLIYTGNNGRITVDKAKVNSETADSVAVDSVGVGSADSEQSYVVYIDSGMLTVNGGQTEIAGNIYKSNGNIVMQNSLIEGTLTITLGEYDVADPVVATNFEIPSDYASHIIMADSETYKLEKGDGGLYLTVSDTVTLDPNGGKLTGRDLTGYIRGQTTVLPTAADIVKTGSTFVGWYEQYDDGTESANSIKSIKPEDTGSKRYKAHWSTTSYWIQYDRKGGKFVEGADYAQHYEYSENQVIKLPTGNDIKREGRVFLGWYLSSDKEQKLVTEFSASRAEHLTFCAKWNCVEGPGVRENYVAPSCTEEGYYDWVVYCADDDCNEELSREIRTEPPIGHQWGEWTPAAASQCGDTNVEYCRCSVCGAEQTRNVTAECHTAPDEYTIDIPADCEREGSRSKRCTVCNVVLETQVIPKKGHTASVPVHENVIPETCTHDGSYDEFTYCTICNKELSHVTVNLPAKGHEFGDWELIRSSSCDPVGVNQRQCITCGYYETQLTEPASHEWEEEYTIDMAATCTSDGSRSRHCKNCSAVTDSEVIPATGHIAREPGVENEIAATCESDGSYVQVKYCEICSALINRTVVSVPARGHSWGDWENIETPDCADSEVKKRVCKTCGLEEFKDIDPLGHVWESGYTIDTALTCTDDGIRSVHCTGCDAKRDIQVIPRAGHTPGTPVHENEQSASCIEPGSYNEVTYCTVCESIVSRWPITVPASGHDFTIDFESNPQLDPDGTYEDGWYMVESSSCVDEGAEMRVCRVCGFTETRGMSLSEHKWMETYTVDKEPTCVDEGSKSIHCSVCGAMRDSVVIPMTGHTPGNVVIENETSESYVESVYCETCGTLIFSKLIMKSGVQPHKVYIQPGTGTSSVEIISVAVYNVNDSISGNNGVFSFTDNAVFTLKPIPVAEGMTFKGWFENGVDITEKITDNGDGTYIYNYTYNGENDREIYLAADYEGYAGFDNIDNQSADEDDTLRKITDYGLLADNSNASSQNQDNESVHAFDGEISNGKCWMGTLETEGQTWIQTGFGDGDENSKLIGAVEYHPAASGIISDYEIYVSNDADFTNPVLAAKGTFENSSEASAVYFKAPYKANFVRLVALGVHDGNTAGIGELSVYEYIGREIPVNVKFNFFDGDNENRPIDSDDVNVITEAEIPIHVMLETLIDNPENANISPYDMISAFDSFNNIFNSIQYNYDIQIPNSFDGKLEIDIIRSVARYDITVFDDGDDAPVHTAFYNQLYKNGYGYTIKYTGNGQFKYWAADIEGKEILCTDIYYTLRATRTMEIYAITDGEGVKGPAVYIPEPVISKTVDKNKTIKWLVQLPVTLIGAMQLNEETNQMEFRLDDITDFGVVVVNENYGSDSAAQRALEELKVQNGKLQSNGQLIRNSGYNVLQNGGLSSKGRYIHQVTFADGIQSYATLYGYMVIKETDADGNEIYRTCFSNIPRSLASAAGPADKKN